MSVSIVKLGKPAPETVLGKISIAVKAALDLRKASRSFQELEACVQVGNLTYQRRPFREAFDGPGIHCIAEIKYASPSEGEIVDVSVLSPETVADQYLQAGARALSILTEESYFKGSPHYLRAVRKAFPDARILMKEFILEEYQILEAIERGADAVLLMVSLLGEDDFYRLHTFCQSQNISALVEIHDEAELEVAISAGAELIGVNNRDLKTLRVSLETSFRIAKQLEKRSPRLRALHPSALLISESGISKREELNALHSIGFRGALVGSSLMRSGEPGKALSSLTGIRSIQTIPVNRMPKTAVKVKICGLTNIEDARAAVAAGAYALGFIFVPGTPRYVHPEVVREIGRTLGKHSIERIGVFVDEKIDKVAEIAMYASLTAVQLHGAESMADIERLNEILPGIGIIKAFRLKSEADFSQIEYFAHQSLVSYILIDSFVEGAHGGTGVTADWSLVQKLKSALPESARGKIILAGGLRAENIGKAIEAVRPTFIDVSSGVELAPGKKSAEKIVAFFEEAKGHS